MNRVFSSAFLFMLVGLLSACNSSGGLNSLAPIQKTSGDKSSMVALSDETKFSSKTYGVAASPRLTTSAYVKKGGGRSVIGKPYKIKGKWYHPKEEPGYNKVGLASWYGPNFHGRLTANGEIYDQTHLSAAHPTFPLPSYARVTNQENGRSVIVRVNDRGPYAHGRIIDLSSKAADMLNTKQHGVAKVRVQYIGRAPLHGEDMQYLLASYRGDGKNILSNPVQVAMNTVKSPIRAASNLRKRFKVKPMIPSRELTGTVNTDNATPTIDTNQPAPVAVAALTIEQSPKPQTSNTRQSRVTVKPPKPSVQSLYTASSSNVSQVKKSAGIQTAEGANAPLELTPDAIKAFWKSKHKASE